MTAHGRYSQGQDWDPMRDDYNNSTYDAQYPDDDISSGVQLDHTRLYITNIPPGLSDDGLRTVFSKFGVVKDAFVSKDATKRYALVRYEAASEAKLAMMKMNKTEPLKLVITIAHKAKTSIPDRYDNRDRSNWYQQNMNGARERHRDDNASVGSRGRNDRKPDNPVNGENEMMDDLHVEGDLGLGEALDSNWNLELECLKLQQLKLQEQQLACKHRMLLLKQAERKPAYGATGSGRRILPDGKIEVRNINDRSMESRDGDLSFGAGAGDSNETTVCSCKTKNSSWQYEDEGSSTPSTCIMCSEDTETRKTVKSEALRSRTTDLTKQSDCSKLTDTVSKRSDVTSKKVDVNVIASKSEVTDFKYSDLYDDSDDEDETNRLIQLRNADYMDIVEDDFKLVVVLAGYPKSKMRLQQMALFQKSLNDIIDMQLKAGLLKRVPCFIDYYLHRGALVCICKDMDTRDWIVRISPGLQERMFTNLVLLKAKVKRLCLAVMKIPRSSWPTTAQDAFKLLQYFNPTLKTQQWKIYSQKVVDDVEITSFLVDRVSGETIRGPTFKNVVDYDQIDFEFTGYTEIYYECLLSSMEEDLHSISSRVKLLAELKSGEPTPRTSSEVTVNKVETVEQVVNRIKTADGISSKLEKVKEKFEGIAEITEETSQENIESVQNKEAAMACKQNVEVLNLETKNEPRNGQNDILSKLKDVEYIAPKDDILVWSDESPNVGARDIGQREEIRNEEDELVDADTTMAFDSINTESERSDSVTDSIDALLFRNSNLNIDSNRGIAYHRRTNYLDVENELKVAITLEGYPKYKLEGTHIRRLKHLFKEYMHKDMKNQRFSNLIMPTFLDVYLSNGAIIYICDSLETKDYLIEVVPKFIHTTGLKLIITDVKDLVRYTRVVMRLPKEKAHFESKDILLHLQSKYPKLNPECWKCYSDIAGKQKRQFGVDPESLEVIRSPHFDPMYDGEKITFRIIDRQKRDVSFEVIETEVEVDLKVKEDLIKNMYAPINLDIISNSITRIRTNHYSDLIADDLKLYIGPSSYPEARIDEAFFHQIKMGIESVVFESYQKGELNDMIIPKFHDIYLFDGVIFVICQNIGSRTWLENVISTVNARLNTQLKANEFRGAVGIISMVVQTSRSIDDVIDILQQKNPRLRTKYWRKISAVRSKNKLDVVLQIDKLSAEVIIGPKFNKRVDTKDIQFNLGHLKSLIKPKLNLEELTKKYHQRIEAKLARSKVPLKEESNPKVDDIKQQAPLVFKNETNLEPSTSIPNQDMHLLNTDDDAKLTIGNLKKTPKLNCNKDEGSVIVSDTKRDTVKTVPETNVNYVKVIIKIPKAVLPENEDDLSIIFELLENKNKGLNTELWEVYTDSDYTKNGKVTLYVDKESISVIRRGNFDGTIGGEKLRFYF